jgi:hypothetical protein
MSKDIEKLSFGYTVSKLTERELTQEQIESIALGELSKHMSNFICKNIGRLPIEFWHVIHPDNLTEDYRTEFYLISKDELRRLKQMEKDYLKREEIK